ncbi:MAG TPA: LysE family transporter [Bacteroidales bacterium]|nr:LysE family transporter [Bacteroidales bacterium]
MNLNPLWQGIGLGLSLAILMGPAFFTLIQTSIYRGLKAGLILAMGVFFSDMTIVILSYLGISQIIDNGKNHIWLGIIGGVILIIFGIYTFYRKLHNENININSEINNLPPKVKKPGNFTYFIKGYVLNIANPFLFIFWMTVVLFVKSQYGNDKSDNLLFFGTMLSVIITTDFIKCFLANKLKKRLKPIIMLWVNKSVGILLILFGIILIIRVFYNF